MPAIREHALPELESVGFSAQRFDHADVRISEPAMLPGLRLLFDPRDLRPDADQRSLGADAQFVGLQRGKRFVKQLNALAGEADASPRDGGGRFEHGGGRIHKAFSKRAFSADTYFYPVNDMFCMVELTDIIDYITVNFDGRNSGAKGGPGRLR